MRLAVVALVACGHASPAAPVSPAWARSGIDWSRAPAIDAPRFVAPQIEELVLANEVHVLLVENHRLPVVEIAAITMRGGSRQDTAHHSGLAALTADLLDEAAGRYSARQLADALDAEGARLESHIATDYATVQLVALSDHLPQSLDLLAAAITRPRFDDGDLARIRATRLAEIARHREQPRTLAAQVFDRTMFSGHVYGAPAEGNPGDLATLTAGEVRAFWRTAYVPSAMTFVVAGDVAPDELKRALDHAFATWRTGDAAAAGWPAVPPPPRPSLRYVDLPGAAQTSVLIGARAPLPNDRDAEIAADVANTVLGGDVAARLDRELHGRLGITFGAGSSFWRGALGASWVAATTLTREGTVGGIRAALALIEATRAAPISAAELARAKAALIRSTAQSFDTTTGTIRALEYLVAHALPREYYATYADAVAAVTAEAAQAAIRPVWTELTVVVAGDWSVIGPPLRALGLPAIEMPADPAGATP